MRKQLKDLKLDMERDVIEVDPVDGYRAYELGAMSCLLDGVALTKEEADIAGKVLYGNALSGEGL